MNCLARATLTVAPALLVLLCLLYVHQRTRASWRKEVVFWISVAVAFATVFTFSSLVRRPAGASLKATLYAVHPLPLLPIWWGTLALGSVGFVACVVHWITRRPPSVR